MSTNAPYDAILGYHLNPLTCGVAKANQQLAAHWGIPVRPLDAWLHHVLVSVKPSEIQADPEIHATTYDLWLHGPLSTTTALYQRAQRVFHAHETGVPAMVRGTADRGAYRVLTFGMAHKLSVPHFVRLKAMLDDDGRDYTVSLSTAVHEGRPWDEDIRESAEALRGIFGERLRVLGFLADDALAKELQECDAVAAYFDPAMRANNTSAWAALAAGKQLFTNLDDQSPLLFSSAPPTWPSVAQQFEAACGH